MTEQVSITSDLTIAEDHKLYIHFPAIYGAIEISAIVLSNNSYPTHPFSGYLAMYAHRDQKDPHACIVLDMGRIWDRARSGSVQITPQKWGRCCFFFIEDTKHFNLLFPRIRVLSLVPHSTQLARELR